MNSSNYRFSLDIHSRQSQVSIPVLLNDTGRSLYISLSDGGEPYCIADGCRAVLFATKADETTLINDCIIEWNTTIRYDFTEQTATAEGITNCEIRLYGVDGRMITSPRFLMVVDARTVYDGNVIISANETNAIDAIILKEDARAGAEEKRVIAERARTEAEVSRAAAEQARDEAEKKRQAAAVSAIEEVNRAVDRANRAAAVIEGFIDVSEVEM